MAVRSAVETFPYMKFDGKLASPLRSAGRFLPALARSSEVPPFPVVPTCERLSRTP